MAKSKAKSGKRVVALPSGFTAISAGGSAWDFREEPMIQGVIKAFRSVASTKFFEGTGKNKKPKMQRVCTLTTKEGDRDVWESAALSPLFDLKKGKKVCIVFQGFKKVKGRAQPMKLFQVGVA